MSGLVVALTDPREPEVGALVEAHLALSRSVTPPGHLHALAAEALTDPDVTVLGARRDGQLVGLGALRDLGGRHAEIKSMHVLADERGRGTGRAIIGRLVALAEARGIERVSLETGTMPAFAPARALYASAGFEVCDPFAGYDANPSSVCMTRATEPLTRGDRSSGVQVRPAVGADVTAITEIANALLATTTYEWTETPHSAAERRTWLEERAVAGDPVLVAEVGREVVGWAAYGEFRDTRRWPGYWPVVEHSVHVREGAWGRGVGRSLVAALIEHAILGGKRVMVGAIDGTNERSIAFHQRLGFSVVGQLPGTGEKLGRELDLVLVQRRVAP